MGDNKELIKEELEKVTGGAKVQTFGGHSVNDSHLLSYYNGGGYLELTIEDIDDASSTPFYVKEEYKRANHQIYSTSYSWYTLNDLNYFWNKSTLG